MSPVSDVASSVEGRREISREDVLCPVCLEIFLEPVTLPCKHTFCKVCFLESVDKATLCCPLCRKRISSWTRLNSRNNSLVDQQLWARIQTLFPQQCERRLSGKDDDVDYSEPAFVPRVSQPGELRQEYEDQVTKLMEERRLLEEEERKASESLIQRMLREEEEAINEERRRKQEDERLARQISSQLNRNQDNAVKPMGQIDRFLVAREVPTITPCTVVPNEEIIHLSGSELQVEACLALLDDPQPLTAPSSSKRKISALQPPEEQQAKRATTLCSGEAEPQEMDRCQQVEEDRLLALFMQKEMNEEERRRVTDRRKGTSDAYLLRNNQESAAPATPTNAPRFTPRKAAPRHNSSAHKRVTPLRSFQKTSAKRSARKRGGSRKRSVQRPGARQTTLPKIFPQMNR